MKSVALFLIILTLVGCSNLQEGSAYKPVQVNTEEKAVVYVFWPMSTKTRIDKTTLFGKPANVYLNFQHLGKLKVNSYIYKVVEPGEHFLSVASDKSLDSTSLIPVNVQVEPGKSYYFAFISGDFDFTEDGYPFIPDDKAIFKQVSAEKGAQLIYSTRLSEH